MTPQCTQGRLNAHSGYCCCTCQHAQCACALVVDGQRQPRVPTPEGVQNLSRHLWSPQQEVKEIYALLEADFNPLELCSKLAPLLEKLPGLDAQLSPAAPVAAAELGLYRPALQRVAITKMLHQLSQVGLAGLSLSLPCAVTCTNGGLPSKPTVDESDRVGPCLQSTFEAPML